MQLYNRMYDYISDYQRLVYDVYSKHAISYPVTYYHLDKTTLVWDDKNLMGGYYERIGELSGLKWDKILFLPIYHTEEMIAQWSADDIGYVADTETYMVIPESYGFIPYPNDVVKFDQLYLPSPDNKCSIYTCTGVSKSTTDKVFYKVHLQVEQSRTPADMDMQLSNIYSFFEYTKKIYTLSDASFLTKMMSKNQQLKNNLKSKYDNNTGYYFL
jgi:hypothetical protein